MHPQALTFYAEQLRVAPPRRVVEFGSCNINGSVRSVYPNQVSWLGIDVVAGPNVDLVADAATWTTDDRFGICICAEVFEHTPGWRDILRTAHTILMPGGVLLASCATGRRPPHSAVDGGPLRPDEFYANVSAAEMTEALEHLGWAAYDVIEADGHFGGDDLYVRALR